jgi:putative acyl-CoA dehydrogenase
VPATHVVTNQVPPPTDLAAASLWGGDAVLREAVARHGAGPHEARLAELGELAAGAKARAWGEQAERHTPVLRTHDARGMRLDEVEYHPAYHQLMRVGVEHGLGGGAWTADPGTGAHVARAAGLLLWSQVDAGHTCPLSMTGAAVPALRTDPVLADVWVPRLASTDYDPGLRPARTKAGSLAGMGMTEKQGGSDLSGTSTVAVRTAGGPLEGGEGYRLTGHKWFCSAPMSDLFLVLARAGTADGPLTCFVVPRVLEDGTRNPWHLQRLKDKLGNRANASSEVELDGTWGVRLGAEGDGLRTILAMVNATRLDCVVGSAATMRAGLVGAVHHARHRRAFGSLLVDQPLMSNVLADLAIESEAATVLGLRLAAAADAAAAGDSGERALLRVGVAVGKYWVCKRTPFVAAEALECLGGNGYVEENGMARLFRESPLNSVWEGSGNVVALDVLRSLGRHPESLDAVVAELHAGRGASRRLDAVLDEVSGTLRSASQELATDPASVTGAARWLVERLAVALQASLLVRFSTRKVADAFLATRVERQGGSCLGTLPVGERTTSEIVARAVAS